MAFKRPSASLIMFKMPSIIKKIVSIIKPLNRITLCPRKDSIALRMLSFYNYDMQNMLIVVTIQCVFFSSFINIPGNRVGVHSFAALLRSVVRR